MAFKVSTPRCFASAPSTSPGGRLHRAASDRRVVSSSTSLRPSIVRSRGSSSYRARMVSTEAAAAHTPNHTRLPSPSTTTRRPVGAGYTGAISWPSTAWFFIRINRPARPERSAESGLWVIEVAASKKASRHHHVRVPVPRPVTTAVHARVSVFVCLCALGRTVDVPKLLVLADALGHPLAAVQPVLLVQLRPAQPQLLLPLRHFCPSLPSPRVSGHLPAGREEASVPLSAVRRAWRHLGPHILQDSGDRSGPRPPSLLPFSNKPSSPPSSLTLRSPRHFPGRHHLTAPASPTRCRCPRRRCFHHSRSCPHHCPPTGLRLGYLHGSPQMLAPLQELRLTNASVFWE